MNTLSRVLYVNLVRHSSSPPPRPEPAPVIEPEPEDAEPVAEEEVREFPLIRHSSFASEAPSGVRARVLPHEAGGCKALLLEIVRRAAYDWVLYRTSSRIQNKLLAEDAYRWLFLEEEDGPEYEERKKEGKLMTSFVAICEQLDLDPDRVRGHIRQMTPKNVMSVGRPAEYRRREVALPVGAPEEEDDDA